MNKRTRLISSILLLLVTLFFPSQIFAATFRSGENVTVTERLKDLYASGGSVDITAPITNDLVVAGGNVRVTEDVSNSLMAAGGNITITGEIGNTLRAAGGNIIIEGPVNNDVVVAGGTITIAENARINGDLVITGGTVRINGPVRGNVNISGGEVFINNSVGGSVFGGDVEDLTLGSRAAIAGDLNYTSGEKARRDGGATVRGQENFTQGERRDTNKKDDAAGIFAGGALYKLIIDIILALLLVTLLPRLFKNTIGEITASPLKTGLVGFATLIIMPILSLFLLILLWIGIGSFLLYFLLLILAMVIAKVFVGWFILRWWNTRNNKEYLLDWKAAVVGPIVMMLLLFIPVIGWLIGFIIFLMALGGIVLHIFDWIDRNRSNAGNHENTVVPNRETRSVSTSRPTTSRTTTRSLTRTASKPVRTTTRKK